MSRIAAALQLLLDGTRGAVPGPWGFHHESRPPFFVPRSCPMNLPGSRSSRRLFLGALGLGAAYYTTPGLFAEELAAQDAGADRRAVLSRQAAARHRQRPAHRQRLHHAGRRRGHAPERQDPRRQGQPGPQRPRRDLAGATPRASTCTPTTATARTHDANFQGFGRFLTGSSGEYYFRTIKPVPYPGRTPHIHFKIKQSGKELLTTQCYIKGEPQNEQGRHLPGHPRRQGPRRGAWSTSRR